MSARHPQHPERKRRVANSRNGRQFGAVGRLVFLSLLCASPAAAGEQPEVELEASLEMSADNPTAGETIVYHVRAELPPGWELKVPEQYDFSPSFQVLKEQISLKKTPQGDKVLNDLSVPLVVTRLGRLKIPERDFEIAQGDGKTVSARTGRIVVVTGSHFPAENEPEAAQPLPPVPVLQRNWLLVWTLVILAVVAVAVGTTVIVLNRRKARAPKPAAPPRPAHEVALERLKELEGRRLDLAGEFTVFYTALSEILRQYLGARWGFDSLDMTTTELMDRMARARLENFIFQKLDIMLQEFDLVKFAKVIPTSTRCHDDFEQVVNFVNATAPAAAPSATPPHAGAAQGGTP